MTKKIIESGGAVTLVAPFATLVRAAADFAFPGVLLLNITVPGSF